MDSKEAIRVLKKAAQLGLMVLINAGDDIGCLPPVHSTPERIRRALDAVPDVTLIAAHMGGMEMWEDAAKYLADTPAYFDTAFVQTSMQPAQFRDLVSLFGARRVLFASDSPWSLPRTQTLAFIERAGILSEEIEDISYKNARALLSAHGISL